MFIYYDDNNESDIEILTSDPSTHIRYSNQPTVDKGGNLIAAASNDVTLPKDTDWTAWNEHRIDWLPGQSAWYINGVSVVNMTYGVPKKPSSLTLNVWSDGGIWSGNMSVGDEAYLQVQWVEMVFNTSGPVTGPRGATRGKRWLGLAGMLEKRKGKGCETVCTVDGVQRVGFPEADGKSMATAAAPGSAAAAAAGVRGEFASLVLVLAVLGGLLAVVG